jgi:transcriptional regulator with XRE-family HTH domain
VGTHYTAEERQAVAQLVDRLFNRSGERKLLHFALRARVSEQRLSSWRHGRDLPDAINLLRLLAAADVIGPAPEYELPNDRQGGA